MKRKVSLNKLVWIFMGLYLFWMVMGYPQHLEYEPCQQRVSRIFVGDHFNEKIKTNWTFRECRDFVAHRYDACLKAGMALAVKVVWVLKVKQV